MNDYFKDLIPSDTLIDSKWRHINGRVYTIRMFTNTDTTNEERYPVTVVFTDKRGSIWSRPVTNWSLDFRRVLEDKEPEDE